jgi:chemotaxis protein MotB
MAGGSGAGDATSVIQGGGQDLTAQTGQVKRGDAEASRKKKAGLEAMERRKLEALKEKLDAAILANPKTAESRDQIQITITPDGLRVQIVDDFNRPMFDLGGHTVKSYMRDILNEIGKVLNEVDNHIALTGHTDAALYVGGERGYSNWELSTERANASRRELIFGGMDPNKVVRVVGVADSAPLIKDDPRNPLNRRISIIVMNKLAEERLARANGELEAGSAEDVDRALGGGTAATPDPAAAPGPAAAAPAEVAPAPAAPRR